VVWECTVSQSILISLLLLSIPTGGGVYYTYKNQMKKIITTLIIFLFIAISVFGVTFMNYAMTNNKDCIASTMTGSPCPTNEIRLFMHHISSFQVFSIAVMPSVFTSLLIIFSLLVFVSLLFLIKFLSSPPFLLLYNQYKKKILDFYNNTFLSWLSLFEHSPSTL